MNLAFVLSAFAAQAHEIVHGNITIHHPWIREPVKGQDVAAAFLEIENKGADPDELQAITIDGIQKVEMHQMSLSGNIARMEPIVGGFQLPPHDRIKFAPGGNHLMLRGFSKPIYEYGLIKGALVFRHAGYVSVEFMVEPALGRGPSKHH